MVHWLLLLQRTYAWSPASTQWLTIACNCAAPENLTLLASKSTYAHIDIHYTDMHIYIK